MYDRSFQPPSEPRLDVPAEQAPPDDQLAISTAAHGGAVVLALHGQLDLGTAQRMCDALAVHLTAGALRMVVDLSGLGFIAVAGTRALLESQASLTARGGSMALACPQPLVARMLQLTGTDQRIPVYDTIVGAVRGVAWSGKVPDRRTGAGGAGK